MAIGVNWQRFEGAVILTGSLCLYASFTDVMPWWMACLLFFAPDLSFAAYAFGPHIGAFVYNAVHIYAFGAGLIALALLLSLPLLLALGLLWLGHSGFDRMLGYGLKSPESFSITHLGLIGKRA